MTPSIRCADFIKGFEACRLGTHPLFDLVNQSLRNPEAFSYLPLGSAGCSHLKNLGQILIAQFYLRVRVASSYTSARSVLARTILSAAYPFKVLNGVVRAISIQMVDGRAFKPSWQESGGDHSVNVLPDFFGASSGLDRKISSVAKLWAKNAPKSPLTKLMLSRAWGVVIKRSHATFAGNLKSFFPSRHREPNFCHAHHDRGILR